MRYYAGVDLGATKIKAIVGTQSAEVVGEYRQPTPDGPTGIAVTEAVLDSVRCACEDADIDPSAITAAGIGSFGPFDLAEGMVVSPANLPASVEQIPLVGPMETLIDSDRVYLHNDTTAAVIGERFHAERNPDDMVYITFSTGIGAGVAVDGHILSGWDGNAGEVGHLTIDPTGRLTCGCGRDGHWEAYASGSGIPRYARSLAETEPEGKTTSMPIDADDFTAATVFDYAGSDPLADLVIDRVGTWNAIGVANLVHAYAPLVVTVGGSVALFNEEAILKPIRSSLDDLVISNVPEIRLTSLGDDVVVHGALASALTRGTGDRSKGIA